MQKQIRTINRLNDYFFKNLMGNEKRSNLTLRFLNLILNRTDKNAFKSIKFLNNEQDPLTKDGKLSILDVKASVDDKTFVNIELQVSRQNYMVERSLFYLSRIFSEQAIKKQNYNELKPAIGINLLDFKLFDKVNKWHNVANFRLTETNEVITDCISMHFLELPKVKYSDIKTVAKLEAWGAYFAGLSDKKELEVLCMNEPLLKEALSYEQVFTNNDEMYYKYQQREDAIREENTKISLGEKRGIEKTKIQNAINFLRLGIDVKTVALGTGLSIEKVTELNMQLPK